jgi:hypothetical protein
VWDFLKSGIYSHETAFLKMKILKSFRVANEDRSLSSARRGGRQQAGCVYCILYVVDVVDGGGRSHHVMKKNAWSLPVCTT